MYSEFQDMLVTVEDRNTLLNEINDLSGVEFSTAADQLDQVLLKNVRSEYRDRWKNFLEKYSSTKIPWQEWKEELKKMKVIHLKVAREFSRDFIIRAADLLKDKHTKENFLLEIEYTPHLLGGVQLVIDGKVWDFSLLSKLQEYMTNNEQDVRKLLFA